MKSRFLIILAMTLIAALVIPSGLAAQQPPRRIPHYQLIVLPTLGGTFGYASGINNRGSITGTSTLAGDMQFDTYLFHKGALIDLGTLGGPYSVGTAVSNSDTVSGNSNTSTPDPNGEDVCGHGSFLICLPFIWQKGVMTALPLLGGNNGNAGAINNRGQLVGGAETATQDACSIFFLQVEPVLWENGQVHELPLFPGDPDGFANAINDQGQITGRTAARDPVAAASQRKLRPPGDREPERGTENNAHELRQLSRAYKENQNRWARYAGLCPARQLPSHVASRGALHHQGYFPAHGAWPASRQSTGLR